MLRREVKVPPKAPFMVWICRLFGPSVEGARLPARIRLCGAPGRSTRNTRTSFGGATLPIFFTGTLLDGAFQVPNTAFNCGMIRSSVVSPATRIFMLSAFHFDQNGYFPKEEFVPRPLCRLRV